MTKTSFSILLFRYSFPLEQWEIVLVKRKHSYEFLDFLRLRKNMINRVIVENMLTKMTFNERIFLVRYSWKRVNSLIGWSYDPEQESLFKQVKMEPWFIESCNSLPGELIWEIPKGKAQRRERGILSAIREFEEETSIPYTYNLTGIKVNYSIVDKEKKYPVIYYIAITNQNDRLDKDLIDKDEVVDVAWVPINQIEQYPGNKNIINVLNESMRQMRLLNFI